MAVSAVGQTNWVAVLRYVLATLLVFTALSFFLYGPPVTPVMRDAAHAECNDLAGGNYRTYRLEWRTMSFDGLDRPHWLCWTAPSDEEPTDLGWWVALR